MTFYQQEHRLHSALQAFITDAKRRVTHLEFVQLDMPEVVTATKMSIVVFWVVTPCGLVGSYQRFRRKYLLYIQGGYFHRNAGMFNTDCGSPI
jgi:carbohydrate-selective porin OprB